MLVKLNYSSKYFIQYNPEVKNNLHSLFLQESPAKDGLLLFKFPIISCSDTESKTFKAFCIVKYTALRRKLWHIGKLFLSSHFAKIQRKEQYLKTNFL